MGDQRELCKKIFGSGGCGRAARLRAILDSVRLSSMNRGDQRIAMCVHMMTSVEQVLDDSGLNEQLHQQAESERGALLRRRMTHVLDGPEDEEEKKDTPVAEETPEPNRAFHVSGRTSQLSAEVGDTVDPLRSAACNVFARCAQVEEGTVPLAELKRQSLESAQGVFASDKERTDGDMIKHALGLRERQDSERFLAEGRDSAASMTLEQFVSFLKNKAQAADAAAEALALSHIQHSGLDTSSIDETFKELDSNHDGKLDLSELRVAYAALMWKMGKRIRRSDIDLWCAKAMASRDGSRDASVDVEEFRTLVYQSAFSPIFLEKDPLASQLGPAFDRACAEAENNDKKRDTWYCVSCFSR